MPFRRQHRISFGGDTVGSNILTNRFGMAEKLLSQELVAVVLERYLLLMHAIKEELGEG